MRILLVTTRYPWPPRRGDQLRAVQLLTFLAPEHEVVLLTRQPGAGAGRPEPLPDRVEFFRPRPGAAAAGLLRALATGLPLQSGLYLQPDLGRRMRRLAGEAELVIAQLARLAGWAGAVGSAPLVIDLVDSLSLNLRTRIAFDRPWMAPLLAFEARRLARWEGRLAERSRAALVVCRRDRDEIARRSPPAAAAKLAVLPLAVEGTPADATPAAGSAARSSPYLAITGNLGYFPNAEGIGWWLEAVWPRLRAHRPEIGVVVAGARPGGRLRRAAARAGVRLVAEPAAMGRILAGATAALAPVRCGSGVPVKILEAWAAGVPVVASPWAAAGAGATAGEELLVAERPGEWVEAAERLLTDGARGRQLVAAARRRLASVHHPAAVRSRLLGIVEAAVRPLP